MLRPRSAAKKAEFSVKTADGLQRRWSERSRYALSSQIAITSEGLVLGGTILAKMRGTRMGRLSSLSMTSRALGRCLQQRMSSPSFEPRHFASSQQARLISEVILGRGLISSQP